MDRLLRLLSAVLPRAREYHVPEGASIDEVPDLAEYGQAGIERLGEMYPQAPHAVQWVRVNGDVSWRSQESRSAWELPELALDAVLTLEGEPESLALLGEWVRSRFAVSTDAPVERLAREWLRDVFRTAWDLRLEQQRPDVTFGQADPPGFDD